MTAADNPRLSKRSAIIHVSPLRLAYRSRTMRIALFVTVLGLGCVRPSTVENSYKQDTLTYHNRISRIIQNHCVECHRTDGNGTPPLENYNQVFGFQAMIRYVINGNIMPPWGAHPDYGKFSNERRLPTQD